MNQSLPARNTWTILLVVLFCLVQAGMLLVFGIYTREEALKYVYEADYFREHGVFSQPKYIFYSGYIFLRVLADALHAGDIGVYIVQLLLNGLATVCFYKLALKISADKAAAYISTALLIFCIPFQKWTAHLYTESLFFSLVIIFMYVLFSQYKRAYTRPVLLLLILWLLIISRPTGMLVIPASLMLASYYLFTNGGKWTLLAVWLPGLAGLLLLVDTAMKGKGEFDFILPIVQEHIICGLPTAPGIPEETVYSRGSADAQPQGLWTLIQMIYYNFGDIVRLGFLRFNAFFSLIRPYYSGLHNALLIAGFYPVYLLAIYGGRTIKKYAKPFHVFALTLIATFAASVMLTCDDWHNRFIMPVMPVIFIYAGAGAVRAYKRFNRKKETTASPE